MVLPHLLHGPRLHRHPLHTQPRPILHQPPRLLPILSQHIGHPQTNGNRLLRSAAITMPSLNMIDNNIYVA